jgi:hypothetical protein
MVDFWHSVRYSNLTTSTDTLRHLRECIGRECFDGKRRYWDKSHHTLFGNHSAKLHLY